MQGHFGPPVLLVAKYLRFKIFVFAFEESELVSCAQLYAENFTFL